MQLSYDNSRVKKYFDNYSLMAKKVGLETTRSIKKQIDRLNASGSFQTFLTLGLGKPHLLTGNLAGYYAVSVSANMRLLLKPECDDYNIESLRKCTVVTVKGLGDYHGGKIEWFIP